jgi:GH18 family chitinase
VPEGSLVSEITHVALAFMSPATFNQVQPSSWPLFTTVTAVRSQFAPDTAIMIAIGGWGDTEGFTAAAATEGTRKLFAHNVKMMVEATGADGKAVDAGWKGRISNPCLGIDMDWEYPG